MTALCKSPWLTVACILLSGLCIAGSFNGTVAFLNVMLAFLLLRYHWLRIQESNAKMMSLDVAAAKLSRYENGY